MQYSRDLFSFRGLAIRHSFIKVLNLCNSKGVNNTKLGEQLTSFKLGLFKYVPHLGPAVISLETANSQLHWAELFFQRSAKNNSKRLMIFPEIHLLLSFPSIKQQRGGAGTTSCYKHKLVFGQMKLGRERQRQGETMRENSLSFIMGWPRAGVLRKRHIPMPCKGWKNNAVLPQ